MRPRIRLGIGADRPEFHTEPLFQVLEQQHSARLRPCACTGRGPPQLCACRHAEHGRSRLPGLGGGGERAPRPRRGGGGGGQQVRQPADEPHRLPRTLIPRAGGWQPLCRSRPEADGGQSWALAEDGDRACDLHAEHALAADRLRRHRGPQRCPRRGARRLSGTLDACRGGTRRAAGKRAIRRYEAARQGAAQGARGIWPRIASGEHAGAAATR